MLGILEFELIGNEYVGRVDVVDDTRDVVHAARDVVHAARDLVHAVRDVVQAAVVAAEVGLSMVDCCLMMMVATCRIIDAAISVDVVDVAVVVALDVSVVVALDVSVVVVEEVEVLVADNERRCSKRDIFILLLLFAA